MKSDIVIAGGGIIGLYSAYLLALRGIKPTLIDKGDFGQQCSWAAGGILTPLLPWNYQEDILFLTRNAACTYEHISSILLDEVKNDIEYWLCGLTVYSSDTQAIENWCKHNDTHYKIVRGQLPQIHLPDVAQIRTPILINALVNKLHQLGVTLMSKTSATQCCITNNKITGIKTSAGYISTPTILWSTGAWAPTISSSQGPLYSPKITPIKGQMIALQNCPIPLKSILYKDGHYLIPRKDGLILAGSTLEDVGYSNTTSCRAKEELWQKSIQLLPDLAHSHIAHHWAGLRPGSKNNIPTIGPHPEIEGLMYNCGHFRYGVAMAPKSCEIITNWIINSGENLSAQEKSYSRLS